MTEMVVAAPDPGSEPDRIGSLLSVAMEAIGEALQVRGWASSDVQVMQNVRLAHRATAMVEALRLGTLRQLNARPEAVTGVGPGATAATFLMHALNVAPRQAGRDVAAASALDPDGDVLPLMGSALAAGEVSRAHAQVAVSVLGEIPAGVKKAVDDDGRTGLERIDAFLTEHSRTQPPSNVGLLARELVAALDPDGVADRTSDAYARRGLAAQSDAFGMLQGRFSLDQASGAIVMAALNRYAAPQPAAPADVPADVDGGRPATVADRRSRSQRQADALTEIAAIALRAVDGADRASGEKGPPADTSGRCRAEILVVATVEQVRAALQGGPDADAAGLARLTQAGRGDAPGAAITPATLARFACDGALRRVLLAPSGAVLDLGRLQRLATAAQRKALAVRDGGCVVPGCTAPPEWSDVHHVHPWSAGGRTDLDGMVLLCGRHHTAVHSGEWQITMRDGVPWIRPPWWVDPRRRLLCNTAHRAWEDARRLGVQLRLGVVDGAGDPLPPEVACRTATRSAVRSRAAA